MPGTVLRTPLCDLLGIEYPVLLAGMGGASGGYASAELVAAVSEAGGLGVLGAEGFSIDQIHEQCARVRSLTKQPFGVDILLPASSEPAEAPAAGGAALDPRYEAWLEQALRHFSLPRPAQPATPSDTFSALTRAQRLAREDSQVEAIVQEKVAAFASGLGSPGPYVSRLHAAGIKVLALVGNVKNARRVRADGADVVVAQGHEAGGHTGRIGSFALTPQVVDAVAPAPVVLAGGVGDGRGLAAALTLGAQGVWVGTAFLATHEANTRPQHKQHIVQAAEEDTRITRFYSGKTMRNLHNELIDFWDRGGLPALPLGEQVKVSSIMQAAAHDAGRPEFLIEPAGQVSGLLKEIRPAADVLHDMVREAAEILQTLTNQRVTIAVSP